MEPQLKPVSSRFFINTPPYPSSATQVWRVRHNFEFKHKYHKIINYLKGLREKSNEYISQLEKFRHMYNTNILTHSISHPVMRKTLPVGPRQKTSRLYVAAFQKAQLLE